MFSQVSGKGNFRTKWTTWSAYLHVNFQNVSLTFHHAIVMLLYLFCLGTNREEGTEVGQHSVLALPLAESLPSGVEASLPLLPSPSDPLQVLNIPLAKHVLRSAAPLCTSHPDLCCSRAGQYCVSLGP